MGKVDEIYSDTKAYVWPGAAGKACTLRNESLSRPWVFVCACHSVDMC